MKLDITNMFIKKMEHASTLCFDAMLTYDDREAFDKFILAKDAYLALELCDKVCSELGHIFNRLGNLEHVAEEHEEAIKYYEQSAKYYEEAVHLNPRADTYCYFAETCVKLKDERAEDLFMQAIELGSKRACLHYGWFLHQRKFLHTALLYYNSALTDNEELSTSLCARTLFQIGLVYHELFLKEHNNGHFESAEIDYEEANNMLVNGQPQALILLPILRSGSIAEFWIQHERLIEMPL